MRRIRAIRLNGVGFRYGGAEAPAILEDLDLEVPPGQTVVTIGDARKAGKSKEAIASAFSAALLQQHS